MHVASSSFLLAAKSLILSKNPALTQFECAKSID